MHKVLLNMILFSSPLKTKISSQTSGSQQNITQLWCYKTYHPVLNSFYKGKILFQSYPGKTNRIFAWSQFLSRQRNLKQCNSLANKLLLWWRVFLPKTPTWSEWLIQNWVSVNIPNLLWRPHFKHWRKPSDSLDTHCFTWCADIHIKRLHWTWWYKHCPFLWPIKSWRYFLEKNLTWNI